MLTEQRYELILQLLEDKKSITVNEVKDLLKTSESTVRRDITALDKAGKLKKVFGGAVAKNYHTFAIQEPTVAQKKDWNLEEKRKIAKYAASLIEPEDFVYLDAGTSQSASAIPGSCQQRAGKGDRRENSGHRTFSEQKVN